MDNGLPITPAASLTRNLLRVADFLPFMYGSALVCMLTRRDFKRLGDLAAATLVVYEARETRKAQLPQVEPPRAGDAAGASRTRLRSSRSPHARRA